MRSLWCVLAYVCVRACGLLDALTHTFSWASVIGIVRPVARVDPIATHLVVPTQKRTSIVLSKMMFSTVSSLCLMLAVALASAKPQQSPQPSSSNSPQFADNLAKCVSSTDVNICLRNTLEELRSYMPRGIPELGLRKTEPLEIKRLPFNSGRGIVSVNADFSDVS